MLEQLIASLGRFAAGYACAASGGVMFGLVLGTVPALSDTVVPYLKLAMAIPTIAWVPILLLAVGLGSQTVVVTIILGAFFVVVFNTIVGVRAVDETQIEAAQLDGATPLEVMIFVILPGALGEVLAGLKLASAYGWRALVGGEMLAAMIKRGLGKMIYEARFWNDTRTMLYGLMLISLSGWLIEKLLTLIEQRTINKWR